LRCLARRERGSLKEKETHMAEIKSYKPGTFCWADLSTTDPGAAKRFYSGLFGWETEDMPVPGGAAYTMARIRGKDVAAISGMMPDQRYKGIPPHWNSYVSVANVDEAVKKATSLGAKVLAPAFDVMDVGRMAVIEDPSGAALSLWQAKKHIGATLANEPGTVAWFELETRNVDACGSFYTKLFGWGTEVMDTPEMKYTIFTDGSERRAGMMPMNKQTPANVPSHWTVYFAVKDCDAVAKKVASTGGKTVVPPTDIPKIGRFSMHFDPQGAFFALFQPTNM